MSIINLLLYAISLSLLVPMSVFCFEVLLSCWPRQKARLASAGNIRRAVLIPAHNEEQVLATTLRTVLPTLGADDRVIVVADNCTDGTAGIAHGLGAEAVVRFHALQRGKGYALDFGLQHLALDPPDVVVFLDADCRVGPKTVELLGTAAWQHQRPVQGLNLCDPDPKGSALQKVSGLAFRFKNLVRARGLVQLTGMTHLTGTGMALPWSLARKSKLADGNVVEDMQLGIDMALAGASPLFLPEARVDSPLPQQRSAARTQRTRWEHGHLRTLIRQTPRLVWLAIKHRRTALLWLAADLAIPPLSLLVALWFFALAICVAGMQGGASPYPAIALTGGGLALAASVFGGWAMHCRDIVPLSALCTAPVYALAKLPIYAAFLLKSQQAWVRTPRDAATPAHR